MINITLTPTQASILSNVIAFRVLGGNYDSDTKDEMSKVRNEIRKEMGWDE